jgi:[ribosomal protein S18]-alanine N-acetyltransferase
VNNLPRHARSKRSIADFPATAAQFYCSQIANAENGSGLESGAVSITIRQSDAKDFPLLFKLDQKCFPAGIAYSKSMLKHFMAQPEAECLVALEEKEIVAFLLTEENPPLGHVMTLDVAEPYRRKGIGSMLLHESENNLRFRGVRTMLLETATTNEAGVAFWQRHGYRIEAVLKNYYPGHLDAYEMRKRLPATREQTA